ncbi:MAG: primosomal protein N', partial [Myxococcales bacterium]|nr:primosomal protein N' [Myxococcales bacterium]
METIVKVALKIAHNDGIFSYSINEKLCESEIFGRRVKVELKNRLMTGAVIGIDDSCKNKFKIKEIIEIIDDEPIITKEQFELMKFTSRYYFNDLGTCVHLAVPKNEKAHRIKKVFPKTHKNLSQLSVEQNSLSQRIKSNLSGAYLLEGITGSGKTHIYIDIANTVLEQKKSVLFIVPEISLTPQLVERVEKALGQKAVVMHSNVSPAQKRDGIFHLLSNDSQILIGARSAIFAPLKNLGLIVVDEEHDSSLKQEDSPQYNARDLALWRAKNERACIILGSATPSLESIYNVQNKKLTHLKLEHRFHQDSKLADIEVIDLKERFDDVDFRTQDLSKSSGSKMCILSRPLVNAIKESIEQDLQVLLFLNQRGYARFGVCYQCGTMVECPHCSVGLTYYQKRQSLVCHQCQHVEYAQSTCKNCLNDSIRFVGLGTERLHEEVKLLFPDLVIERLDRDVIQSQIRLEKVLKSMHDRTAHILIGTQMIAKGHDFLHVGLVGVVCADVGLSMPDF